MTRDEIRTKIDEIIGKTHHIYDPYAARLIRNLAELMLEMNGISQSKLVDQLDQEHYKKQMRVDLPKEDVSRCSDEADQRSGGEDDKTGTRR